MSVSVSVSGGTGNTEKGVVCEGTFVKKKLHIYLKNLVVHNIELCVHLFVYVLMMNGILSE